MRRGGDASLLEAIDARGAVAVSACRAQSDFDDQQYAGVHRDDVEFAASSSIVAQQDFSAGRHQMRRGDRLGFATEGEMSRWLRLSHRLQEGRGV